MKIGVIAESFRKPLMNCLDEAAEMGFDGVQLYCGHHDESGRPFLETPDTVLKKIADHCRERNLVISALCGDISPKSFQVTAEAPERVDVCKRMIDILVKLDVHIMTTHIGHIPESCEDPVYPIMVHSIRQAAEYAADHDCVFAIETGPELADVLKTLIEAVDSRGLKVNLDPANLRGVSCEDPVYAVRTLAPYIVHTHAKDAINTHVGSSARFYGLRNPDGSYRKIAARAAGFREVPLGQGQVDWDAYLAALREIGYDGFLTIERECGDDPAADIRMAGDFLREKLRKMC